MPQKLIEYVKTFWHHLYGNGEIVKENLAVAQAKLKRLYDRKAVVHRFSPGVQVRSCTPGLLPIISSPFQVKFHSPFTVLLQVSEQNYLLSTPNLWKHSQLCHVNLLNP